MKKHEPTQTVEAAPRLLKPSDAAETLAISDRALWSLTASGELPCVRIGRSVRYDPADLAAFVGQRKKAAKPC